MAEPNPMRWVVLALVAAGLFAGGLYMYIRSAVDGARVQAEAEARVMTERMEARDRQVTAEMDVAQSVASAFVAHVAAGRFGEAHALLAAPYRAAATVDAFAASCRASPILISARAVTFQQLRKTSVGRASTIEARGLLEAAAGGVPVTFTFMQEAAGPRVLAVALAGVPVLQGISVGRARRGRPLAWWAAPPLPVRWERAGERVDLARRNPRKACPLPGPPPKTGEGIGRSSARPFTTRSRAPR